MVSLAASWNTGQWCRRTTSSGYLEQEKASVNLTDNVIHRLVQVRNVSQMQVSFSLTLLQHILLGSLNMPSHTNLARLRKGTSCCKMNSFSSAFRTVRMTAFSSETTTPGRETATPLCQCSNCTRDLCLIPTQLSAGLLNVVFVKLFPSVDHQLEGVAVVLEGNPVWAVDLMRALDGNIIWCDGDHFWNKKNKWMNNLGLLLGTRCAHTQTSIQSWRAEKLESTPESIQ